jgi:hypothetical protein
MTRPTSPLSGIDTNLFPELPSLMYKESSLSEQEKEKEKEKEKSPVKKSTPSKSRTHSPESISSSQRSMPSFFGKKEKGQKEKGQKEKGQKEKGQTKKEEEQPQPPPTWLRRKIKGPIAPQPSSPKEKGTTYDKEKCKKFIQADPTVQEGSNVKNPFTNKPITKGKATYKKILKECQEQHARSPKPTTQAKKSKPKKSFILPGESFEDLDVKSLLEED